MKGKNILIVGGSSGIGKAAARKFLEGGANLYIIGRNPNKLEKLVSELGKQRVQTFSVDMTDEKSLETFFKKDEISNLDHVVISASSAVHGSFVETDVDAIERMFNSKFFGPYKVAKHSLSKLRDGGSITFFSGVLSRRPGASSAGLSAVNSAVEGLTRALAFELGPRVRVNCISPGMVKTEAYSQIPKEEREKMYEAVGESLPVKRVGEPDEIADAVLFVTLNNYLTGKVIDIDGGHLIS